MGHTRGLALIVVGVALAVGDCIATEPTAKGPQPGASTAGGGGTSSVPATAPAALDERELARLIAQLGDSAYQVREAATARLLTVEFASIPALKKARQETNDEEIRMRLGIILAALPLWDGRQTVAQYARRIGVRETAVLDLGGQVTMKMTLIPAGKFLMGSPESEPDRDPGEFQHEVTISQHFYMGVTHVTVDQFAAFVKDSGHKTEAEKDGWSTIVDIANGGFDCKKIDGCSWRNPGFAQNGDHPVVEVSWNDALAFCAWLSKKSGRTVTLPTDAQWEYACRAGTTTVYPWGDGPDDGKGWANCADQSLRDQMPKDSAELGFFGWDDGFVRTAPVGRFKPNAWGLYDMTGNAWQWCADWYGDYEKGSVTDPTGPTTGSLRVQRGGAWNCFPSYCRSAYRCRDDPGYRIDIDGFRVVVLTTGGK